MTMSKDRVRFTLLPRYFQSGKRRQNGFHRDTMMHVLKHAFGMTQVESTDLMDHYPNGFEIECRPSQFARFIILRHDANEGINGIRDLEPRIVQPSKPMDPYQRVAEKLDLCPDTVRAVIRRFYDDVAVSTHFYSSTMPKCLDVSQRPA